MKKQSLLKLTGIIGCVMIFSAGCSLKQPQAETVVSETVDVTKTETMVVEEVQTETVRAYVETDENAQAAEDGQQSGGTVEIPVADGSEYKIEAAGTYLLTGQASDFTVRVEADKEAGVQIVLRDAQIQNTQFPVIYVVSADQCTVTATGDNVLAVNGEYVADGETNTDAVVFSKADLIMEGEGTLSVTSPYGNGISAKDALTISGGNYTISCGKHGLEVNDQLTIDGGTFTITAKEGMEATYVQINDGEFVINASDDGINATANSTKCEVMIEINGGMITIVMGPGDTDGLDANGSIVVNGGTIDVTGQSAFDYDYSATYNGGTIIINGEVVDEIPASMMGGGPGGHHGGGFPEGGFPGGGFPEGQGRPEM